MVSTGTVRCLTEKRDRIMIKTNQSGKNVNSFSDNYILINSLIICGHNVMLSANVLRILLSSSEFHSADVSRIGCSSSSTRRLELTSSSIIIAQQLRCSSTSSRSSRHTSTIFHLYHLLRRSAATKQPRLLFTHHLIPSISSCFSLSRSISLFSIFLDSSFDNTQSAL